jgi:NADH-quinone oxidoreductase subunit D
LRVDQSEFLDTDLTEWEIGPFHGSLPAPMKLRLQLDGEVIVGCEIERGYLHRELEKSMEIADWDGAIALAGRLDPEASASAEYAFVGAVEAMAGIEVSPRTQWIRTLVLELNRVSSHLGFFARISRATQGETMSQYVIRDRERLLDLLELMTGSRFMYRYFRYGGLSHPVSDGALERVLDFCRELKSRIKEYNDLFTYNRLFRKRSEGVGALDRAQAQSFGVTGPNLRASGGELDLRILEPYLSYGDLDLEPVICDSGDVHSRYLQRLYEVDQSLGLIRQLATAVPEGETEFRRLEKVPKGENGEFIESPRGVVGCHVVSSGGKNPARVFFRSSSSASLASLPSVLVGYRIEDLAPIISSFDLSIAEIDK